MYKDRLPPGAMGHSLGGGQTREARSSLMVKFKGWVGSKNWAQSKGSSTGDRPDGMSISVQNNGANSCASLYVEAQC